MISETEVRVGQIYAAARTPGRFLTVASVALQKKTAGKLKARYTYATCTVGVTNKVHVLDTDVLRGPRYRLHFNPPAGASYGLNPEASTPQGEP